jgi:hypothetical protein
MKTVYGMKVVGTVLCWTLLVGLFTPGRAKADTAWSKVLSGFVDEEGQVDYAGLKAKSRDLDGLVKRLGHMGPASTPQIFVTRADSLAFWLNAYNALVVHGIVAVYPVGSVRDILPDYGFFRKLLFAVDGQQVTLDQIEHGILIPQFQDPRVHAAINCAAKGCPRLSKNPFVAALVDSQLNVVMREMVWDRKYVRLDLSAKTLYLSQIFSWYRSDFSGWLVQNDPKVDPSLVGYIAHIALEDERRSLITTRDQKIVFLEYDWSLNDQASPQ